MGSSEQIESEGRSGSRRVVYCLVPPDLADKLHDYLCERFRGEPGIEVVVERRGRERRRRAERRAAEPEREWKGAERRQVRAAAGRRVGERRARQVPVAVPELPRRARRHADQLSFVERIEPATQRAEDADTARLVARFQAGDRDAFNDIYTRYFHRVYGYLRVAFRDAHEAEDAAQQVFMQVFENLDRYGRRRQPFRAWLFTIARHHAIRALRKLGRVEPMDANEARMERELASTDDEPQISVLDWITDPDLTLFVERLPLPQRQVLVLGYSLDLSDRQIAAILERSPADIRTLRHRALRFLEARLRAIGRVPQGDSTREPWVRRTKKAPVLRNRRHALDP